MERNTFRHGQQDPLPAGHVHGDDLVEVVMTQDRASKGTPPADAIEQNKFPIPGPGGKDSLGLAIR